MKLNLGSGRFPLDGFVNLDETNWLAEGLLVEFADESIEAITISHMLMYLPEEIYTPFFISVRRVLRPGGVVRVTEDDTGHPLTSRPGVQPGAVTATAPGMLQGHMAIARLGVLRMTATETYWKDGTLRQQHHGDFPDVFFVEGFKVSA